MHHLVNTRSHHFVGSPRRTGTPMKRKLLRHPSKRRKIGSIGFAPSRQVDIGDQDESEDDYDMDGPSRRERSVLSAESGQQIVNQSHAKFKSKTTRNDVKGKGKAFSREEHLENGRPRKDLFNSESDSSPRKRKRNEKEASDAGSGSWVEVEDEEEPEFIAESDQHLLREAPAHVLQRLLKAELIRLWKVAGMWDDDNVEGGLEEAAADEDDDNGLGKKELVDGLLTARQNSVAMEASGASPSSPRTSPKRKAAIEAAYEIKRLRSASGSVVDEPAPALERSVSRKKRPDMEATPRNPPPRNRRARVTDVGPLRSVQRQNGAIAPGTGRIKRGRDKTFRARSKSMGGEQNDRRARFGDEVKSPSHGMLNDRGHTRSASTQSSAYSTTDADVSPDDSPVFIRHSPARNRRPAVPRGFTPARRLNGKAGYGNLGKSPLPRGQEVIRILDSSDEEEPTPLVQRLRSRGRNSISLAQQMSSKTGQDDENGDADYEDTAEDEGDEESVASPQPRRLRSRDKQIDSDVSMGMERKVSRPERSAKVRAMQAINGAEEDEEGDAMDVDGSIDAESHAGEGGLEEEEEENDETVNEDGVDTDMEDDKPRSGPLTRSQLRVAAATQEGAFAPRHTRRNSRISPSPFSPPDSGMSSSVTPSLYEEDEDDDTTTIADGDTEMAGAKRTTRSGKAFGAWKSRKRRLRQEAIEDPDMEAEEEEEDEEEDDDEEDEVDESAVADIDLSQATQASLVRLLRDELVQMCEARGLEVGGTKPKLAKSLLEWWEEQQDIDGGSAPSSSGTARPRSSRRTRRVIHAIGSHTHVPGKVTPVLLRDHIHVEDPATPTHSEDSRRVGEAELNLDLQELGLEDSIITSDQLQKLERIGSGGFKDVYVGKFRGRKVAISEFRDHLSEMDVRELKLLAEFSHPNIVKFRGICIPDDNSQVPCMLVSELCENGDLFDYIRNVPRPSVNRVLGLMLDIARGLEYLHTRKPAIIHRDCKSSNILINRNGQAKVGDFGLARVKTSARSMIRSLVGTVNWQAPELWSPHPRYDYKVDVFSAAMVYWEMMSGWTGDKKYPWEGHNEHYIYDAVGSRQKRPSVAGLRKHWRGAMVDLMEKMWSQDPASRPTMTEVVNELESLYYVGPLTPRI